MTAGDQAGQGQSDLLFLAKDDIADRLGDLVE